MKKKISPTLIGGFVIGALVLFVIAVIAFGSGQLLRKTREFVLYFDSSVNGLRIGAPVKVKGVEIGSVKDISLSSSRKIPRSQDPSNHRDRPGKVDTQGEPPRLIAEDLEAFRKAIAERGLRGQLMTESLVDRIALRRPRFFSRRLRSISCRKPTATTNIRKSQPHQLP